MSVELDEVCSASPVVFPQIGRSTEGRPLGGGSYGGGPLKISLGAGAHADEPVGPRTLERLAGWLETETAAKPLLEKATFSICPDINPDGRERNSTWTGSSPADLRDYLRYNHDAIHARDCS